MPKKPPVPLTIGINPLDQVIADRAVAAMVGKSRRFKAGERPDTAVLTVTVPAELADDLEQIISITPGTDLDTLATEALQAVLAKLQRTAKPSAKGKGSRARSGGSTVVILGE